MTEESQSARVLVTGASGFVGFQLVRKLIETDRTQWGQIVATSLTHNPFDFITTKFEAQRSRLQDCQWLPCDLADQLELVTMLDNWAPNKVVHCAALSAPNECEVNPKLSDNLNVQATRVIAKWCQEHHAKLVFCSTDLVFDGQQPPYSELDSVSPIGCYGKHKVLAEQVVLEASQDNAVVRLPWMFGSSPIKSAPLSRLMKQIKSGDDINLFIDEIRSPLSYAWAAKGLLLALESHQGVLHLAGPEPMSRLLFAQCVADIMQIEDTQHLRAIGQKDLPMAAPRPENVTLVSDYAEPLGFTPPSVVSQIKEVIAEDAS